MYFILFSHMFLSISRKALQRAKLRRLTTPTRNAASAYNVTIQGLQCVNENSSYFRSGKPMSHVQHDVQNLRRGCRNACEMRELKTSPQRAAYVPM